MQGELLSFATSVHPSLTLDEYWSPSAMQHHDCGMPACGPRSEQINPQLGPAVSAGKSILSAGSARAPATTKASETSQGTIAAAADKTKKFPHAPCCPS